MDFIVEPAQAAEWSARQRRAGATIGFVPTMGALHEGHLALIRKAKAETGAVACSIFVNPLQFTNAEDLKHYPRRSDADRLLLEETGCDMLFAPDEASIYADFHVGTYDLGGLDLLWEGPSRPGHFQGMVNVVERLFHYVRADRAYFGEKDRQQLAIVRYVAEVRRWPEMIVPCATQRAVDGLALSSRNQRLSEEERRSAPALHRALQALAEQAFTGTVEASLAAGRRILDGEPSLQLDYWSVVHPKTLQPIASWDGLDEAVALVAAQLGQVRLIDNITLHR